MTARPYFAPFVPPYADSFGCRAVLLDPESRDQIEFASPDPRVPIRIRQNLLAAEKDLATLRAGVRLIREISAQAVPLTSWCRSTAALRSRRWCRTATSALSAPDRVQRSRSTPSILRNTARCTASC
jgi:GMC oxidoreductase